VARNVVEAMIGVAEHDGLALPDGRPVAAKTGTVQSRFDGQNNDAWMAGFTPSLTTAVWMGTDMNSPIRTARGTPIQGSSLPGDVWQDFMADALVDAPVEDFPPFRPIGEPPASHGPDEERLSPPSIPPSMPPSTPPSMPPPAPAPLPPAANPEAAPPPDEPEAPSDEPDDPAVLGDAGADDPEDEDCSATPCG
jgi:peptidoglycan glycosyltransferase